MVKHNALNINRIVSDLLSVHDFILTNATLLIYVLVAAPDTTVFLKSHHEGHEDERPCTSTVPNVSHSLPLFTLWMRLSSGFDTIGSADRKNGKNRTFSTSVRRTLSALLCK